MHLCVCECIFAFVNAFLRFEGTSCVYWSFLYVLKAACSFRRHLVCILWLFDCFWCSLCGSRCFLCVFEVSCASVKAAYKFWVHFVSTVGAFWAYDGLLVRFGGFLCVCWSFRAIWGHFCTF